jgi:hypothetical protein
MAYNTIYPASPNGGTIYTDPTVFSSSGTYTIPPTATANSTIMVECISGGSGGGGTSTNTYWVSSTFQDQYGTTAGNSSNYIGSTGKYFIGVYRLGFLSSLPAGQTITVNVGAGGTGKLRASSGAYTSPAYNSGGNIAGFTAATSGGTTSLTYSGFTFASVAGGIAGNTDDTTYTISSAPVDSTFLTNNGYRGGRAKNNISWTSLSSNTFSGLTQTSAGAVEGRADFGEALGATLDIPGSGIPPVLTAPGTVGSTAVDGSTSGQGGSNGTSFVKIGTTGTYTWSRAGNGAAPGGVGGTYWGYNAAIFPNASVSYTFPAGQWGGNGGAGRVRIWYSA